MADPKKIAEIHARTRPGADARGQSPAPEQEWDDHSLPLGSRVGEFEITGIIGKGGFGIVYLAWDHSLERVVALKEYMPASFASRTRRIQVNPLSERHRETFQVGLSSFVNEAKLLAQFHSPSLVEVHRFWEENGTAYMVMPYYRGSTLGATVRALAGPPGEAWLLDLLAPVTEALMELHSVQCYHRDVAPDNILILDDTGSPLLLDFGAARRVIAGQAHALTIILKAGYAPIEQYGDIPGMQQGPWTDVYALASVVYWAVTGKTPPAATARMVRDPYVPLAECAASQYSASFLAAIDRALVVLPEERTASITQLRNELGLSPLTVRGTAATFRWSDPDATVLGGPTVPKQARPPAAVTASPAAPEPSGAAAERSAAVAPATQTAATTQTRRPLPIAAIAGAGAVLVAAAAGAWLFHSRDAARPAPDAVSTRSETRPPAPPIAPPPVPKSAPAVVAETIPVPQSATDALALILARKDTAFTVGAAPGGSAHRSLTYTSGEPGYLYLIGLHEGDDELKLLSPGPGSSATRISASGKLDLPAEKLKPGTWKFALVIARQAMDLAGHGWVVEDGAWKRRFAADMGRQLPWDIVACVPSALNCRSAYGAAGFELNIDAATNTDVPKPRPAQVASPAHKAERPARPPGTELEHGSQKSAKAALNPECEKILMRMSLGEAGQELIDRMKTLKCN